MVEKSDLLVVDASVVLAVLLPDEKILPKAEELLETVTNPNNKIIAPELLEFEVGNGLRSAAIRERVARHDLEKLVENFMLLEIQKFTVSFGKTMELALENNLSFYDAAYVCLALRENSKLLSLDSRLIKLIS